MHALDTDIHHLEYFHIIEILPSGHIVTIEEMMARNRELEERSEQRQLEEAWEAENHGSCLRDLDTSWVLESRHVSPIWGWMRNL